MNNFTFYNPTKIHFGKGSIDQIGGEIQARGLSNILLLTGSGSIRKNGVYSQVIESLKSNSIGWVESRGVTPNPILSHAEESLSVLKENDCDAILAVGGGSVIDEAKAIAAGCYLDNIWDAYKHRPEIKQALPIFTVLTLSGTGSEMNPHAVLTNENLNQKWAFGSPLLYPQISIIDPSVQTSLPWHQTVNGGIDAMTHVMEYYFRGIDEEITLSMCEAIMRTIIITLDGLKNDPDNYDLRANLAWSATLALNGTTAAGFIGGEWASHQIEHGISALYPKIAHGAGLAIIFPAWIEYVYDAKPKIFERWAINVWNSDSVMRGINRMKSAFRGWGASVSLSDIEITETAIENIAANATQSGPIGNIKRLKISDVVQILKISK